MVFLTDEKINKIMSKANRFPCCQTVTVRELASFIGPIDNGFDAVLEAPLHYRNMERNKIAGLGHSMCFDNSVELWPSSKVEIQWWLKNVKQKNGKPIKPLKVTKYCMTDASKEGWGTIDVGSGVVAQGRWSLAEKEHNINYLKVLAVFHALRPIYKECSLTLKFKVIVFAQCLT